MKRTSAAVLALLFAMPAQAVRLDSERKSKVDQITPENMDPWVYKFSKENMDNFPQWHMDDTLESKFGNGVWLGQKGHHNKKHRKDIAERGMDEEVHGFATANLPPLNTRVRSNLPFIPNGSDPKAFEGVEHNNAGYATAQSKHHKKHGHKDYAERGMDTDVH